MPATLPHVVLGVLTHNSSRYLPHTVPSYLAQRGVRCQVLVLDNASSDDTCALLQRSSPAITVVQSEQNLGFSAGHNALLRLAVEQGATYYACINADCLLAPDYLAQLCRALENTPDAASATGHVYRWYFPMELFLCQLSTDLPTDTTGIAMSRAHHWTDIAQGQRVLAGAGSTPGSPWGVSGAAAVYKLSALEATAHRVTGQAEYFDELINMYKEDVELSYRLRSAGYGACYVPTAHAWHDRTVASRSGWGRIVQLWERITDPQLSSQRSYAHQRYIVWKYRPLWRSTARKWPTWWRILWQWLYMLLLEPQCLRAWWRLQREEKPAMLAKQRELFDRILPIARQGQH
ncbi:glycosyltransferase [Candidatus Peribacteria bacterium]|nr:glycosyltransferase [Candidatus Peribacteria bacterium]